MDASHAFDLVETSEGRWDVQLHGSLSIVGYVWHTGAGFIVWDWADRQIGVFTSLPNAVQSLRALDTAR